MRRCIKEYQQNSHLVGADLWNECWKRIMSFELQFAYECTETFFLARVEYRRLKDARVDASDQCYSLQMHVNVSKLHKSKIAVELENHTAASPNDTIKLQEQEEKA